MCEICGVILNIVRKGKPLFEICNEVKTTYSDKSIKRTSVYKWCCEFENGQTPVQKCYCD